MYSLFSLLEDPSCDNNMDNKEIFSLVINFEYVR